MDKRFSSQSMDQSDFSSLRPYDTRENEARYHQNYVKTHHESSWNETMSARLLRFLCFRRGGDYFNISISRSRNITFFIIIWRRRRTRVNFNYFLIHNFVSVHLLEEAVESSYTSTHDPKLTGSHPQYFLWILSFSFFGFIRILQQFIFGFFEVCFWINPKNLNHSSFRINWKFSRRLPYSYSEWIASLPVLLQFLSPSAHSSSQFSFSLSNQAWLSPLPCFSFVCVLSRFVIAPHIGASSRVLSLLFLIFLLRLPRTWIPKCSFSSFPLLLFFYPSLFSALRCYSVTLSTNCANVTMLFAKQSKKRREDRRPNASTLLHKKDQEQDENRIKANHDTRTGRGVLQQSKITEEDVADHVQRREQKAEEMWTRDWKKEDRANRWDAQRLHL